MTGSNAFSEPYSDRAYGIGLLEIVRLLRRNLGWLVIGSVVGLAGGAAYCLLATPIFHSQAEVLVMRKVAVSSDKPADDNLDEEVLATHLQILRSPQVVDQSLGWEGLDQRPSIRAALREGQTPAEYVIANLQTHKGGEGSGRAAQVLHLRLRHTDAADCQAILEAIVAGYSYFLHETTQRHHQEALLLARQKLEEMKLELARRAQQHEAFRESVPLLWKGEEPLNGPRHRAEMLEADLTRLRVESIEAKSKFAAIRQVASGRPRTKQLYTDLLPLVEPEHLDRLKQILTVGHEANEQRFRVETAHSKLLQFEIDKSQLLTRFGKDHPKLKEIQRAVQATREFLHQRESDTPSALDAKAVVESYVRALKSEMSRLDRKVAGTRALLDQANEDGKALTKFELEERRLLAKISQQQQALAAQESLVTERELAADSAGFITKVIAPARIGEQISPRAKLFLPLGALLGVGLATTLVLLRDQVRQEGENNAQVVSEPALSRPSSQPTWSRGPASPL